MRPTLIEFETEQQADSSTSLSQRMIVPRPEKTIRPIHEQYRDADSMYGRYARGGLTGPEIDMIDVIRSLAV